MEGSVTMQEDTLPRLTISYQKNVIWFGQLSFAKAHKARASSYLLETGIVSRPPPRQLVKTIRQSLQCIPDPGLFNAQYMTRMARIALMPPKAMRCRPSETL